MEQAKKTTKTMMMKCAKRKEKLLELNDLPD